MFGYRHYAYLLVILDGALAAPAIPTAQGLTCFALQTDAPPGIDTDGTQHLSCQRIDRGEVGGGRRVGHQPRIALRHQPRGGIVLLRGDAGFGSTGILAPVGNLAHRQTAAVNGEQVRRMRMDVHSGPPIASALFGRRVEQIVFVERHVAPDPVPSLSAQRF